MDDFERIEFCLGRIRRKTDFKPDITMVLGSGLGGFAERIEKQAVISYCEIEGFPVSTVSGHAGRFVFGTLAGKAVAIMQGRVHLYEGYTPQEVVLPLRVLRLMGAETAVLTNASGGISPKLFPGDIMLITDHISTFVPGALRGGNIAELGPRFPDMTGIYDARLCERVRESARELGEELKEGVYLQTVGPQYETPAEIRMYSVLGADAVGMSTAIEAGAAAHMGMKVCGLSCVTNKAAGLGGSALSHEEVKENAAKAADRFEALLAKLVEKL